MSTENIIYGPSVSVETSLNMELGLSEYLLEVTKNHLDKVLMVSVFLFLPSLWVLLVDLQIRKLNRLTPKPKKKLPVAR